MDRVVAHAAVVRLLVVVGAWVAHRVLGRRGRHHRGGGATRRAAHRVRGSAGSLLGRVQVRLLLRLADVLLVADPLVPEPVGHLRHGDAALAGQLLLGLLGWVGVAQVAVEVLVQDLRGLFAEVAALATSVQEARAEDHHGLAGALLELHLDRGELLVDDLHHPLDLLRRDGARAALLPQKVHDVRRELVARLLVLLELLVVDLPDLRQFRAVIRVLDRVVRIEAHRQVNVLRRRRGTGRRIRSAALLRPGDALGDQHVVETHQLWIWGLLLLRVAQRQDWKDKGDE